jgi:Bacterial Ig domain
MRAARIGLIIAVALSMAAPADAAVRIGSSTLPAPGPTNAMCVTGCTIALTALPVGAVTVSSPGVITRWQVRAGMSAPDVQLQVVRGSAEVAHSAAVKPKLNGTTTVTTRLPIAPNDHIALEFIGAAGSYLAPTTGASIGEWIPPLTSTPGPPAVPQNNVEVLINADVEPDADSDGFGDETQDNCPGIAQDVQSDRDHDGFGDACDTCPDVAGAGPHGCPVVASPAPPPNKPPTARFRTPLSGRGVGPTVRIELDAADDHGLPVVSVFDDDGTICVLRAAPYACTWRPTGADVGRATLLASAVDSAGLSSLAIVRVRVNRFAVKLTKKAKRTGGRLRVTGRLVLPATVTRAQGCRGKVTVRVRTARRTVPLTPRCTYRVSLRARTGRPRVRFGGNPAIAPT